MNLIFGGGGIATDGIVPAVGGEISDVDVTSYRHVADLIATVEPDVVINCAGISRPATVKDSDPDEWAHEVYVNLIGSYHVARAAVEHDVGTMIFLSSVSALHGKPNHSGYCASKAGVTSLVQSLAFEGHNAYAISPGRVNTRMREQDYPGEDPRTRLDPLRVGEVVRDILFGRYESGDDIICRKIGFDEYVRVNQGEPWRTWLRIGLPSLV